MESNRPNNQQGGNKGGIHKSSQAPHAVILFSIRDNSNELITRFQAPKQKIRKSNQKDEGNHIHYMRGAADSLSVR